MRRDENPVTAIDWYVACLLDRIEGKPVRGMGEAKEGYQRATAQLARAVEGLDEAIKVARLFNRGGMTWMEYDRKLVELEQLVNHARGQ